MGSTCLALARSLFWRIFRAPERGVSFEDRWCMALGTFLVLSIDAKDFQSGCFISAITYRFGYLSPVPTGLAVLEFSLCCGTNALRFPLEGEKMEPSFAAQSRDDLVHIMLAFGFYLEVRQEAVSAEWFSVRQSYLVKLVWNAEHIVVEVAGEDIHRDVAHVFPSSTVIPSAFDGFGCIHSQTCQAPTEFLMDVRVI